MQPPRARAENRGCVRLESSQSATSLHSKWVQTRRSLGPAWGVAVRARLEMGKSSPPIFWAFCSATTCRLPCRVPSRSPLTGLLHHDLVVREGGEGHHAAQGVLGGLLRLGARALGVRRGGGGRGGGHAASLILCPGPQPRRTGGRNLEAKHDQYVLRSANLPSENPRNFPKVSPSRGPSR